MNPTINITHFHRRLIVLGFVGGFLGSLFLHLFFTTLFVPAVGLQFLGLLCTGLLLSWGSPRLKKEQLDERQLQIRNDAYFRAYLILSVLALATPVVVMLLVVISEPAARQLIETVLSSLAQPVDFVTVFGVLAPFVGFLPWAMLAWLEPEPIQDEIPAQSSRFG